MSSIFVFGAVGGGIADDTESLQHAIDSGDGVLRLHKGRIGSQSHWSSI